MMLDVKKLWSYTNCGGGFMVAETEKTAIQTLQDKYDADGVRDVKVWLWEIDDYYDKEHPNVLDVMYTRECWVTKPVVMRGRKYRITGYERDNYILPIADDEATIRIYLKGFIGYDERMSLYTLFNKFVQYAGQPS